ncbi:MAG: glycosyltransferase [Rhodospirillales bacterium]|nr:glycosyltransferase [Rhodospirillales bacterium]
MSGEVRHLLHVFPSFAVGGAQARFCALANHFGPRYRHSVIALDGDRAAAARLDPRLDVAFPEIVLPKRRMLAALRACHAALGTLRPDRLVTYNWGAIEFALANRLRGIPHLHVEDGFGPEERDRQLPRRVRLRRLALARSAVALPSRTLLRLASETWRLDRARLHYVPNGIAVARFRVAADPALRAWAGAAPLIGTVAGLRAEKNIARLLAGFAPHAAMARLAIAGDGPQRAALEAEAARLGIAARVRFLGACADPAPIHAAFDIFALSSDTEQMPLTLMEAMARGAPVAASDVGDVAAMVAEANRPFIVPAEAAALSRALGALLADAPLRARLGAANRARAEAQFDQARMFADFAALFDGRNPALRSASDDAGPVRAG